jgi:hypothetical protein
MLLFFIPLSPFYGRVKGCETLVINNNTDLINKSREQKEFPQEKLGGKEGGAQTRHLGEIEHTLISIGKRINRIDTWAMILLCLFIDLLVPLAIYFLVRRTGKEREGNGPRTELWNKLTGKQEPTKF